jgi:dihydroflavonol-4-reductase
MVVVTGATGHIGNALIRELVAHNIAIRALVLPGEDLQSLEGLPVEFVTGDITDYDSLLRAFEGANHVYHLAGIVSISSGDSRKGSMLQKVNIEGTRNVVRACFARNVKRLIFTSSIHAFPELPHGQTIVETKDFKIDKVLGGYARSKAEATNIVLDAVRNGLDAVIVHPTGVIGPYEYKRSNIGQLIVDFLNKRLYAYIDGAYDFVDVRDVARGLYLACEKGRKGENYILSGEQLTVKQLINYLAEFSGIKAPDVKIPIWFARLTAPFAELYYLILRQKPLFTSYSLHTLCSNSLTQHRKATEELGYNPRPIKEAIFDAIRWIKGENS